MLGASLPCHIFERDICRVSLLVHLRAALAHVKDARSTAHASPAHASHNEYPYSYDKDKRQDIVKNHTEEIVVTRVLVAVIAHKLFLLFCIINKLLHLIDRTELHFHRRFLAGLVDTLLEDVAHMFGLDIHVKNILVLVDHDF